MTVISAFSHLALGVPDIEASARFYCGVFGFERAEGSFTAAGEDVARLLDVDDADLEALFIRKDGLFLELLKYTSSFQSSPLPRRDNEYGFIHLSFRVSDLEETNRKVEELGGTVLESTRIGLPMEGSDVPTTFAFCLDPSGNRIELIQHADDASIEAHRQFLRVGNLGWSEAPLVTPSQT